MSRDLTYWSVIVKYSTIEAREVSLRNLNLPVHLVSHHIGIVPVTTSPYKWQVNPPEPQRTRPLYLSYSCVAPGCLTSYNQPSAKSLQQIMIFESDPLPSRTLPFPFTHVVSTTQMNTQLIVKIPSRCQNKLVAASWSKKTTDLSVRSIPSVVYTKTNFAKQHVTATHLQQ